MTTEITETLDATLAHYGKRGMKWGVRNDLKKLDAPARSSYLKTKDAAWKEKVDANPKLSKVSRIAARDAKRRTKKLKADYKAQGKNIRRDILSRTRYDGELKTILEQSLDRASYKVHKTSPSRLNEVAIHRFADGSITATVVARSNAKIVKQFGKIAKADEKRVKTAAKTEAVAAKIAHAAGDTVTESTFVGLEFFLVTDDEGFVDDIITPFDDATHDDLEGDDFLDELDATLAHFGIPGMKWGHRKSRGSTSVPTGPELVLIKQNRKGNLETAGGRGHNPSVDALSAVALRQKAHASGVHSLSNPELQSLVTRMNLESNYQKALTAGTVSKQKGLIEKFIEGEKNMLVSGKLPKSAKLVQAIIAASAANKYVSRHNPSFKR